MIRFWRALSWIFAVIVVGLVFLLGLLLSVPVSASDNSAPVGFCDGGVQWVIRDQATLVDPGCPSGIFILDIENVRFHLLSFDEAEAVRAGRDSMYWFEPLVVPTETLTPTATLEPTPTVTATATPIAEPTVGPDRVVVYLPLVLRQSPSVPVTAPPSFCNGGVAWVVPSGSVVPQDPRCGSGRFAVDIEGSRTWVADWDRVLTVLNGQAGTIWFEPSR